MKEQNCVDVSYKKQEMPSRHQKSAKEVLRKVFNLWTKQHFSNFKVA